MASGTTKLKVYNGALRLIGEAALSALTDAVESRRVLDGAYDECVQHCLESGFYSFSIRAVKMASDDTVTPNFGYTYAFARPGDLLRVYGVWSDAAMTETVIEYSLELGYFYANITPIYMQYVSDNASYGLDLTKWPAVFTQYVQAHLASEVCERLTQNSAKSEALHKLTEMRLRDARNRDVMDKPARFPPVGSWVNSRTHWGRSSSLRGTGRGL